MSKGKKKASKKPKPDYDEKIQINASFEELIKMAAEGTKNKPIPHPMTRRQLYRWILKHGCEQASLPDQTTAFVIYFENPRTGGYATLNTPIGDREMRPTTVRAICMSLGIEIPPDLGE